MTPKEALDQAAMEFGQVSYQSIEILLHKNEGDFETIQFASDIITRALDLMWNAAIDAAADSAEILTKKKSQHKANARWSIVKGDEVDLFEYEIQYSVNKQSILKLKR